jgi:hypothetical protein
MASLVVGETKEKASALQPLPPPTIDNLSNLHYYQVTEEEAIAFDCFLKTFPDHSDVLPGKIIRFLRARKLNLKQTNEMLSNHLAWVEKLQPNTITVDQVDKKAMDSGCWRYVGKSLNGVPVAWVQVGKWNPHEYTVENYEVYVCYFNSMLERLMAKATQQIVIFDMAGWAFWHASYMSYIKRLIDLAQNQGPERLHRVILVNSPFIFRASWYVIKPWMDARTARKVVFVSGAEDIAKILAELKVENTLLPIQYGGDIADVEATMLVPGFPTNMTEGTAEEEMKEEVKEEVKEEAAEEAAVEEAAEEAAAEEAAVEEAGLTL